MHTLRQALWLSCYYIELETALTATACYRSRPERPIDTFIVWRLRDQVVAINGRAGAGKTVSLATLQSAAECDGYVVQGLAPTSMATMISPRKGG
jgi:hypothetical protein